MINTDGLVLIGPGSEWFWTALSGVVLAITFVAIYRQLKIQRDTAALQQVFDMERAWTSERMSRSKLDVAEALRAGVAPLDIPDKASSHIGDFWERMGYLTRTGYMNRTFVYEQWSMLVQQWWARLRPSAVAVRERDQEPEIWVEFEWLATQMAAMDRKRRVHHPLDPESLARDLPNLVEQMRQAVAIDEALRTITVRIDSTPVPVIHADGTAPAAGPPNASIAADIAADTVRG